MKNLLFLLLSIVVLFGACKGTDPEPILKPVQKNYFQAKINGQKDSVRSSAANAYWKSGMLWVETNIGGNNITFYLKSIKDDPNIISVHNMGTNELSSASIIDLNTKKEYNTSISASSLGSFIISKFDTKDSTMSGSFSLKAEALDDAFLKFTAQEGIFSEIKISGSDKSTRVGELTGKMTNLSYKFPIFEATAGKERISFSTVGPDIKRGYWVIDFLKDLKTNVYKFDNNTSFRAVYVDYRGEIFDFSSGEMLLIKNDSVGKSVELSLTGVASKGGKKIIIDGLNAKFTYK